MAIHSINNFKHLTGQTEAGRRRSPFLTLSYNADQALHDEQRKDPEKPYHLKHPKNDNTKVVLTEIYSTNPDCQYADATVSSAKRRELMWNDLVRMNKKHSNRIMAYSEIALPNIFEMHMIDEFSKRFCESLSEHFNRPIDWSVHDKTKNGKRNLHGHICIPERELNDQKWGPLSVSYYLDFDGNPIYDKKYKNAEGHDIRKPRIKKNAPADSKYETEIDPRTGKMQYKYQETDSSGRKKWIMQNNDWLNPNELTWIHNEYDRICNQILKEYGINDTVKRYNEESKAEAEKAGLKIVHSNIRDAKGNTSLHQENEQNNKLARIFMDNHEKIKNAQNHINSVEMDINLLTTQTNKAESQKKVYQEDLETAISDLAKAETILEKHQRYLFKTHIWSRFETIIEFRNHCLAKTEELLNFGIAIINKDIQTFKNMKSLLPSQKAKLKLLEDNKKQILTVLSGIQQDKRTTYKIDFDEAVLRRWRTLDRESKAGLVYALMGDQGLSQYKDFYNLASDRKINKYFPGENAVEQSFKAAIEDCEVPYVVSNYKQNESAQTNLLKMFNEQLQMWQQDLESEYHTPPRNMETLLAISTAPEKFIQNLTDNRAMDSIITAVPSEYTPLMPYRNFINSWSEEEYKMYNNNENEQLEALRTACIDTQSETKFNIEKSNYEKYLRNRKMADLTYQDYLRVKKEEEAEAKKRSSFIFEGTVDNYKIEKYWHYYQQEMDGLNKKYPDGFPKEPNYNCIRKDVSQDLKHKTPKELMAIAKELKIPAQFISNYITAKAAKDDYASWNQEIKKPLYGVRPVTLRWKEPDYHELSEMEKAERNLYKGWNL